MKILKVRSIFKICTILTFLFATSHIIAQINTEYQIFNGVKTEFQYFNWPANKQDASFFKHNLGIGLGQSTGFGLSYRYFPAKLGVQGNLGLHSEKEYTFVNIGATFLYSIHTTHYSNFYLYQANSYNHQRYPSTDIALFDMIPNTTNFGLGLGLELIVFDNFAFNMMYGYGVQGKFRTIMPGPEFAFYYKFN